MILETVTIRSLPFSNNVVLPKIEYEEIDESKLHTKRAC
jgi:hypothetical protein